MKRPDAGRRRRRCVEGGELPSSCLVGLGAQEGEEGRDWLDWMRGDLTGLYDWRERRRKGQLKEGKAKEGERDPTTTRFGKGRDSRSKQKGKSLDGGAMQQGLAVVV